MASYAADMSPNKLRTSMTRGPKIGAIILLLTIVLLLSSGVYWAKQAKLDEVTTGMGQVIPSSEIQVVQNLEGGIVSDILVREGDTVEAGQILMRIDDTSAAAGFQELRENYFSLLASVARLTAEAEGKELVFPEELSIERPDLVARERQLFQSRRSELISAISILEQQRTQRRGDLQEMRSRVSGLRRSFDLVNQEYELTAPLVSRGMVARVDVIRLEREMADIRTQIRQSEIAIPNAKAAISEANQRIEERKSRTRGEALTQLGEQKVRLASIFEQMRAREDRVTRTEVRAPFFTRYREGAEF